ncbi:MULTISPECIES: MFS transporter [Paraburkholderia]|uniref:Hexuronate transporter n=2 Tax=Paraburkholderia TaxID=1822464 RepID=A0A6J5FNI5_9BURK|nr:MULTISPECIES: MFS transporter [Paraburkholderia]GGC64683.1 hexuronate transporter [Paraburkholderia caffeinilytica]CAB3782094.1 Hexuronate transporter [Paraburkholderia caffeinitolerans]CAB3802656.1 Hexuronate transporter [Paraburkholderia caffeinilytica]
MKERMVLGLRWWIIGLVSAGITLNYLSRSSLSVAIPELNKHFSISTEQYSYIVSAFQGAYMIVQPLCGYVLDIVGTKIGFAVFAVAWALANMLHGLATGWISFAFFRGLLGATESAVIPASVKVVSEWFPDKEKSIATGWFNSGTSLGAMFAPPLVVWCILHYNWQMAFIVTGGLSLIWVVVWLAVYDLPQKHKWLGSGERSTIIEGQAIVQKVKGHWTVMLRSRVLWGIMISRFLAAPAWATFSFWIPIYLSSVRHMSLKEIGMFAWLPFLAADLGSIVGGYLCPSFQKWFNVHLVTSRKLVVVFGALLMIGPACIGLATDKYVAVFLFCIGGFAHQALSGALLTLPADVFQREEVATASGWTGTAAWLGSSVFSLIIGALATKIGYNPLFACLVMFDALGAIVLWVMVPSKRNNEIRITGLGQQA